jgi:hypothetical protein
MSALLDELFNILFWWGVASLLFAAYQMMWFDHLWRRDQRRKGGELSVWLLSPFSIFLINLPEQCRRRRRKMLYGIPASAAFALLGMITLHFLSQVRG